MDVAAVNGIGAQESLSENARKPNSMSCNYTPGQFPALDREVEQRAAMGGAVWAPHLVGQEFISFGAFLERAEVLQYLEMLFPQGSDAAYALSWLRERKHKFPGTRKESRAELTKLLRDCPLFERRGYRHVQNAFGAIFDQYDDLLKKQGRNLKLSEDWVKREKRRKAHALRERKRKAKRLWVR